MKAAEIARRLWHDYLKVEYYHLSDLARAEWNPDAASHSRPLYAENGDRLTFDAAAQHYHDALYDAQNGRDDHYAVRTYIMHTNTMGAQCVDGLFPDEAVFGHDLPYDALPQGIPLVGRIMGALGYRRGVNNLGPTYFQLNSLNGDRKRDMFVDAIHLDPPIGAPELPKQFVSQIHISDLRGTHPKLAAYIADMMYKAPDPLAGLEHILTALREGQDINDQDAHRFLEAAATSIKERPWKLPLERALEENWTRAQWDAAVVDLQEIIAEHEADPTEASQYAVWTIFNGLRVNHEAFLTGNIWDTMLCHVIAGRKIIDPVGTEKSFIAEGADGTELGGLLQAAVAAIPRVFSFEGPDGARFDFAGEGPFVEYIERTMVHKDGLWQRVNDAFLPGNAKNVFQSTMPKTRGAQSWAEEMRSRLNNDPKGLLAEIREKGWINSTRLLEKIV